MNAHYQHTQVGWVTLGAAAAVVALAWATLPEGAPVVPLLAIAAAIALLFGTLTVEVDHEAVRLRFGIGLVRKRIPLARVQAWDVVRNPVYAGWGIHGGPGFVVWNVSGSAASSRPRRDAEALPHRHGRARGARGRHREAEGGVSPPMNASTLWRASSGPAPSPCGGSSGSRSWGSGAPSWCGSVPGPGPPAGGPRGAGGASRRDPVLRRVLCGGRHRLDLARAAAAAHPRAHERLCRRRLAAGLVPGPGVGKRAPLRRRGHGAVRGRAPAGRVSSSSTSASPSGRSRSTAILARLWPDRVPAAAPSPGAHARGRVRQRPGEGPQGDRLAALPEPLQPPERLAGVRRRDDARRERAVVDELLAVGRAGVRAEELRPGERVAVRRCRHREGRPPRADRQLVALGGDRVELEPAAAEEPVPALEGPGAALLGPVAGLGVVQGDAGLEARLQRLEALLRGAGTAGRSRRGRSRPPATAAY